MSVDVESEIEIARPREEVATFACDPDNATAWYRNITAVEWNTLKPVDLRRLKKILERRPHTAGLAK